MPETFLVPFDYNIRLARRSDAPVKTALRRATAAIEVASARMADMPVAYRVAHDRDLGPGRHLIVRHDGRLCWPLVETTSILEPRSARDFLRELRMGRSDLFVRRRLDDHHLQDHSRCRIADDDYDDIIAAVRRNSRSLLVVDDMLYAAGGIPIVLDGPSRIRIAGTGANRAIASGAGDLRIKAANGHWGGADLAICRGRFFLLGSVELAQAMERRSFAFRGVGVEAVDGEAIDPLVVCIDAAFREAWRAMNKSISRTRPEGFAFLRAQFLQARGPMEDDGLTAARYYALRGFLELYEVADRKPVAVIDCLEGVRQTMKAATSSGRFRGSSDCLEAGDEAALDGLADTWNPPVHALPRPRRPRRMRFCGETGDGGGWLPWGRP